MDSSTVNKTQTCGTKPVIPRKKGKKNHLPPTFEASSFPLLTSSGPGDAGNKHYHSPCEDTLLTDSCGRLTEWIEPLSKTYQLPNFEFHLIHVLYFSSERLTHASSCGAAIQITRTSVRLRKGLHSMGQNVPLGK